MRWNEEDFYMNIDDQIKSDVFYQFFELASLESLLNFKNLSDQNKQ